MAGVMMASSENPIDKASDRKFSTTSDLTSGFLPKVNTEDACSGSRSLGTACVRQEPHELTIKSQLSVFFVHILVFQDDPIVSVVSLHHCNVFFNLVPLERKKNTVTEYTVY